MMILDTNVISALMAAAPDPTVIAWLDRQPSLSLWITSITVFEIRAGLALMPAGRRRAALDVAFEALVTTDLEGRVLDFDRTAASAAATIAARRSRAGRTIDIQDTQIAGIAASRRGAIATRNMRHFSNLELTVVNPWA